MGSGRKDDQCGLLWWTWDMKSAAVMRLPWDSFVWLLFKVAVNARFCVWFAQGRLSITPNFGSWGISSRSPTCSSHIVCGDSRPLITDIPWDQPGATVLLMFLSSTAVKISMRTEYRYGSIAKPQLASTRFTQLICRIFLASMAHGRKRFSANTSRITCYSHLSVIQLIHKCSYKSIPSCLFIFHLVCAYSISGPEQWDALALDLELIHTQEMAPRHQAQVNKPQPRGNSPVHFNPVRRSWDINQVRQSPWHNSWTSALDTP
jgi:hypothetical protein